MRLSVIGVTVGIGLLCGVTLASAQDSQVSLAAFETATVAEKRSHLRALLSQSQVDPRQLVDVVEVALGDQDVSVRISALDVVIAKLVAPVLTRGNAGVKSQWERERPEVLRLRTLVTMRLEDTSDRVRIQAVSALQALDFDGTGVIGRRLSADTIANFARRYKTEPVPYVRTGIIAALGGAAKQSPDVQDTLVAASRDADASVRQIALRGIMELGPPVGLPVVVVALGDADATVRREASVHLVRSGPAAKPYLSAIEAALIKGESDAVTRANLEGALRNLR